MNRRHLLSCLVLWCVPLLLAAEQVRVASFNLQNYLSKDRSIEGQYRPNYPKPEVQKTAIRRAIAKVSPDVLALQEIGGSEYLLELQRDLKAEGIDYPHSAILEALDTRRYLAVLSRVPIQQVVKHDNLTIPHYGERRPVSRGLLEVHFSSQGQSWALFNVHLKSRMSSDDSDPESIQRRTREAQVIRDKIREQYPPEESKPYLIAGDFNDTINSAALRRFLTVSDTTLTEPADAEDSRGERWTYHHQYSDTYSRIDFLLLSPALKAWEVPGSATLVDNPDFLIASDHRMIYLDLNFTAAER